VRGEHSAEALDLRMACLHDRLGRLRALVDVFTQANATVVKNALGAADALPALESCADTGMLHAMMAPPQDQSTRIHVETLRRDLARVEAVGNSGQCASSVEAGRKLVDQARAVGYLPLEAEALNALARAGSDCLDPTQTVQLYKEALRAAVASHHDEAAVAAAVLMSQVMADRLHDVRGARDWLELGRAVLRPIASTHPLLEAWALSAEGLVYRREGYLRAALQQFQRALALQEKTLGPDHLEVALTLNDVGAALRDINRVEESVTQFDRARRLGVQLLGPDHPQVALYLANRGEALNALRLYSDGLADNQRALEIWKAAGASTFHVADGLTRVAESLLGLGRTREAVSDLEEAMRLHEQNHTPFFPGTRFALARALWPAADQRPRAVTLAEQAKADYERAGADPPQVGAVDTWLHLHQLP
jgi:tetratricopeptide (TPR) repeat protein